MANRSTGAGPNLRRRGGALPEWRLGLARRSVADGAALVRFGFGLEAKPVEWSICRQWRAQRGFCCRGGAVVICVQSPLRWRGFEGDGGGALRRILAVGFGMGKPDWAGRSGRASTWMGSTPRRVTGRAKSWGVPRAELYGDYLNLFWKNYVRIFMKLLNPIQSICTKIFKKYIENQSRHRLSLICELRIVVQGARVFPG
jgi:hypothetical protein